jgi:hypothetical protein
MYRKSFPSCPVDGPIEPPVPFVHMFSRGAVPKKCSECLHLFEGECTRYIEEVQGCLTLDHGPCGIAGPTEPVMYQTEAIESKLEVPQKCATCIHAAVDSIHGVYCTKDRDKWGDFHRGLDWGAWRPNHLWFRLQLPKVTTQELSRHAYNNEIVEFIKEHRRINPGISLYEAKQDFVHFRTLIEQRDSTVA